MDIRSQRKLAVKQHDIKIENFSFGLKICMFKCDWIYCKNTNITKLKWCAGCHINKYCNKYHQKCDWKLFHRYVCTRLTNAKFL